MLAANIPPPKDGLPLSSVRLAYLSAMLQGSVRPVSPRSIRKMVAELDEQDARRERFRAAIGDAVVLGIVTLISGCLFAVITLVGGAP